MQDIIEFLKGKKSYIIAGLAVLFGILGWSLGFLPQDEAVEVILAALGLGSLRNAMPNPK